MLIKGNAQRKWKKLFDTSNIDTIELWHSKKVTLLANP